MAALSSLLSGKIMSFPFSSCGEIIDDNDNDDSSPFFSLTIANQMLSLVGSLQSDPFSDAHVPQPAVSTTKQADGEASNADENMDDVVLDLLPPIDESSDDDNDDDPFTSIIREDPPAQTNGSGTVNVEESKEERRKRKKEKKERKEQRAREKEEKREKKAQRKREKEEKRAKKREKKKAGQEELKEETSDED